MLTSAIILDNWKLRTFKRYLDEAGYTYTQVPGPIVGTQMLKVSTKNISKLRIVLEAAKLECSLIPREKKGG